MAARGDQVDGDAKRITIKKYGNRRLYDTARSRYITLQELDEIVRAGNEVRVVDARTAEDLTQQTLVQLILEQRGAGRLLPVPVLLDLIRLSDHRLADFFGNWLGLALEGFIASARALDEAQRLALPRMAWGLWPGAGGGMFPWARAWMGGRRRARGGGPARGGVPAGAPDDREDDGDGWDDADAGGPPAEDDGPPAAAHGDPELAALRAEIDALRARVEATERGGGDDARRS